MLPAAIATPYGKRVRSVAAPRVATPAVLRTSAPSRPLRAAVTSARSAPHDQDLEHERDRAGKAGETAARGDQLDVTAAEPPGRERERAERERGAHRRDAHQQRDDAVRRGQHERRDGRAAGERVGDAPLANVGRGRCERDGEQHREREGHG